MARHLHLGSRQAIQFLKKLQGDPQMALRDLKIVRTPANSKTPNLTLAQLRRENAVLRERIVSILLETYVLREKAGSFGNQRNSQLSELLAIEPVRSAADRA
jgi:hypothetical protein